MEPDDVIQVKVGQKQIKGLFVRTIHKAVQLVEAVAGIKNQIKGFGPDEDTDGIPHVRVVPAVGAQKDDFHIFLLSLFKAETCS